MFTHIIKSKYCIIFSKNGFYIFWVKSMTTSHDCQKGHFSTIDISDYIMSRDMKI